MTPHRESNEHAVRRLKAVFAEEGARGALAYLNSLTGHRFTSLFRFDVDQLRSVTFYDRENPRIDRCEDIPVTASYCVFVRDSGEKFATHESRCDARVDGHPKQTSVQSYCGVPLLDRDGKMFGSICHFDFKPGRIDELDVELLEYMAALLQSET